MKGIDDSQLVRFVRIEQLLSNPFQPRFSFDRGQLEQLAASLKRDGLIQPLAVRAHGPHHFQIIAGERRKQAAAIAGLAALPCIVREATDADMMMLAIIENDLRVELNPIERALAYERVLDTGISQNELSKRLGRSSCFVNNAIQILKLPEEWKLKIARGEVYGGVANDLAAVLRDVDALARIFARAERLCSSARYQIPGATVRKLYKAPAVPYAGVDVDDDEGFRRKVTKAEIRAMVADEVRRRSEVTAATEPPPGVGKASAADTARNGDAAGRGKSGMRKRANGSTVLPAFPERERSAGLDEEALESLKGRWFDELLTRELERRGVTELLKALGVDLAEVWRRGLCEPFTYEYFDLHGKGELMRLAEELGVPIEAVNSKMILIRQLMAHPKTKERLPAELAM